MPRTKKTENVQQVDQFVGERVEAFRNEHEWTLADLSQRLGVSVSHLKALEAGRYSFSASMLVLLSETFKRPVHAFLPETQRPESLAGEWEELRGALLPRDLRVLLEMGRKLIDWNPRRVTEPKETTKVVSLEGIDGTILREIADKVVAKLNTPTEPVSCVWYDFEDPMTKHLVERILDMKGVANPDAEIRINHAFEKTLLFACERLQRQQTRIRPALQQGHSVITPFFTMAAGVYYEVDGSMDRRAVESIETQLLNPDLVVVVDSDPSEAARRASLKLPLLKGTFYSPYEHVDQFKEAMNVYEKMSHEFMNRGYHVLRLDARKERSLEPLVTSII
ncbi:MAG TPA: helix-turn-helix domain-containing protein, partial [Polyangium sp.]|nr:helix-turn-helix domain-containing protein [Polyangium sp.]